MKKLIIIVGILMVPIFARAQQPKMHIKMFGGWNASRLALRIEGTSKYLHGWQAGGGFRVLHRKTFLESDITFLKYGLTYQPAEDVEGIISEPLDIRIRSLEIPLNVGYVPVNTPAFKWFLYGGLLNKFILNGRYTYEDEEETFKPGELNLHIYNLGARIGTQVDIGLFNIDFSYTIGITNSFKGMLRTNSHCLLLSVGLAL
ncbi:MAG: PorT family protein [Bacteroidetes bacterium]|nr:PorT family protein [Bacteroidota bacterium]